MSFCLVLILLPALAHAQASRLGPTFSLGGTNAPVEGPDVAHDGVHNQYLQVAGKTFIEAHLVSGTGTLLATFRVNATGDYAQTPRVAFSPDIAGGGGYLVTWHATVGTFARVRGRLFRYDGVPVSGDFEIGTASVSVQTQSNWTMGAAVAYSTTSREFLVAWMGNYTTTNDVFFQRVNSAGALLGGNTLVSPGTPDWDRDPSVAYNPDLDEFFIAYAGYLETGRYGYVSGRRVKAGTGAFGGPQINYGTAVSTYVPAVTYNSATQQYLLGWYNRTASGAAVYGATLNAAGAQVGDIRVLSSRYFAYDALDIDYNQVAGQFLLVTHGGGSTPWEDGAVAILGSGVPVDNGFIITNTPDVRPLRPNPSNNEGNYNPRVASSTTEKKWLMATSSAFSAVHAQFAASAGTGGPITPTPRPSSPRMTIDVPLNGSSVVGAFTVSGWAVDTAAVSGNGVDVVHVWAYPSTGAAPIFLGVGAVGNSRPDVGAYLADTRFTASGYSVTATLAPGIYDLRAYAFSLVAGGFNNVTSARVTVTAPLSLPRMFVDTPAQNQTITQNVSVSGWAIDQASTFGAGVEALHVWAYPVAGGAPLWVGASAPVYNRPDIATYFASSRFATSGFLVQGTLPPGEYNLVVFAFSVITRTFNQAVIVRVRVV